VSAHDKKFFDNFMLVLGVILLITVFLFFLARQMSGNTQEQWLQQEPEAKALSDARLKPVGTVVQAGDPQPQQATVQAPVAAARSGADVYAEACAACHGAGIAGAPRIGDSAAWAPRIGQGMDTLVMHATQGFQGNAGYMPAKGGRVDLSDADVASAVEHMVSQSQ
jgi:cytochrome c5